MPAYGARAIREAVESGLSHDDVTATLAGMSVTDSIPPRAGEPIEAYAARATGELMVRYIGLEDAGARSPGPPGGKAPKPGHDYPETHPSIPTEPVGRSIQFDTTKSIPP